MESHALEVSFHQALKLESGGKLSDSVMKFIVTLFSFATVVNGKTEAH